MKFSLVLVPIIFLVALNACATPAGGAGEVPTLNWTAAWQTMTATYAPPPSPTVDPNERWIVEAMNAAGQQYSGQGYAPDFGGVPPSLAANLDYLEDSIGADFTILNADFPVEAGAATVFQIYASCECTSGGSCCTAEHMLVQTIRELYLVHKQFPRYPNPASPLYLSFMEQIPPSVQWVRVLCLEQRRHFSTFTLPWQNVVSFLNDQSNGYMLGTTVTQVP